MSDVQEQNEALLRQLHQREGAIRDLMAASGATAAQQAAFVASIASRWDHGFLCVACCGLGLLGWVDRILWTPHTMTYSTWMWLHVS